MRNFFDDKPAGNKVHSHIAELMHNFYHGVRGFARRTIERHGLGRIPLLSGTVEQGDYLETGYLEQEMTDLPDTSCIEEI